MLKQRLGIRLSFIFFNKGRCFMAKMKKGQILECEPCGREVAVNKEGVSHTTVYCCGKPMKQKAKVPTRKTTASKTTAKKITKKVSAK
jgi:hypothetical protein